MPSVTSTPTSTSASESVSDDTGTDTEKAPTTAPEASTPPPDDGDLGAASVATEQILLLDQPIDTVVAPNGEWWIAQRTGEIVVVDPDTGETGPIVLDIGDETQASGERGLLGIAIDAEALYTNFTDLSGNTHVEAWLLDEEGRPGERHLLLTIDQPFSNHNGGGLAIGPDRHLYIAVGDGGSGGDPLGAGQDPANILGSILRIDPTPSGAAAYEIPPDNPYADGVDGRPEIFLIGARNPWRFSFDPQTDDLWVADVGQDLFEEVNLLLGANGWGIGSNLGWNLREATHEFSGERPDANVDPVFEYAHRGDPGGCSITGGHVYRGSAIAQLVGSYVFGDFCTSTLWAVSTAGGAVEFRDFGIDVPGADLAGFGVDPSGELVVFSLDGPVSRIVPG